MRENRRKVTLACRLYRLADDVEGFCGGAEKKKEKGLTLFRYLDREFG